MHFFILGGNGRTGMDIISEAISRGHSITALVRSPSALEPRAGLTVIKGTPTDASDVVGAFAQHRGTFDAVLVALSAPRKSDNPFAKSISPPRLMTDCVQNALTAMRRFNCRRIVVMQAFGVGSSLANNNFLMRLVLTKSEMAKQFADHDAVDALVRKEGQEAGIEWTLLRPAMLKGEEPMDVKVFGDDGKGASWMPSISRPSVARFMVVRCLEKGEFVGRTPMISN